MSIWIVLSWHQMKKDDISPSTGIYATFIHDRGKLSSSIVEQDILH